MPKSDHVGEPTKSGCPCLYAHPLCSNSKAFDPHMCLGWCLTGAKHTTTDLHLEGCVASPTGTSPSPRPCPVACWDSVHSNHFSGPFSYLCCPSPFSCLHQSGLSIVALPGDPWDDWEYSGVVGAPAGHCCGHTGLYMDLGKSTRKGMTCYARTLCIVQIDRFLAAWLFTQWRVLHPGVGYLLLSF